MTELVRKAGRISRTTVIACICAFGGGVVGAAFQAGAEHQSVTELKAKIPIIEDKLERMSKDDTNQKERLSALESTIPNTDETLKTIMDQHRVMLGDLGEIRGELTVLLRQLPVSDMKMKAKGLPTTRRNE